MDYQKYLIKKEKLDLLSSLKALNKELLNEKFKEFGVDNINELKDYILEDFAFCLDYAKDDVLSKRYFEKILDFENSEFMAPYEQDIESLMFFIYDNGNYYSYYIPTEIKKLIKKLLAK